MRPAARSHVPGARLKARLNGFRQKLLEIARDGIENTEALVLLLLNGFLQRFQLLVLALVEPGVLFVQRRKRRHGEGVAVERIPIRHLAEKAAVARHLALAASRGLVEPGRHRRAIAGMGVMEGVEFGQFARMSVKLAVERLESGGDIAVGVAHDAAERDGAFRARLGIAAAALSITGKRIVELVAVGGCDGCGAEADDEKKHAREAFKFERGLKHLTKRFDLRAFVPIFSRRRLFVAGLARGRLARLQGQGFIGHCFLA